MIGGYSKKQQIARFWFDDKKNVPTELKGWIVKGSSKKKSAPFSKKKKPTKKEESKEE
jgi:hypothetical protein